MTRKILSLLLLSLFVSLCVTQKSDPPKGAPIPSILSAYIESETPNYQAFYLSDLSAGHYVAVSVSVKGGSLLRVYASVKNPRPSSPLDSDKYTEKSSQTLMMLPYDLLKDNKFLYLGFICDSPLCETTVSIGFAKEFEFIVDDYPQTYFPETLEQSTAAVFKIKMPESAKNADRIVIQIGRAHV